MNVNVNINNFIDQLRLEVVNILCNTLSENTSALRNMCGQLLHLVTYNSDYHLSSLLLLYCYERM